MATQTGSLDLRAIKQTYIKTVAKAQPIYKRTNSNSAPAAPTSKITATTDQTTTGNWTLMHMARICSSNTAYKYLWTCNQFIAPDGTFLGCSDVVADEGTTVIDGANITTGTVAAERLNIAGTITAINNDTTTTINGGKITANSLAIGAVKTTDQASILNSNVQVGGRNLLKETGTERVSPASASQSAYVSPTLVMTDYADGILNNTDDWFTYSFDYKVTGNSATGAYVYAQIRDTSIHNDYDCNHNVYDEPTGKYVCVFKLTSTQATATSKTCNVRLRYGTDGAVLTVSNAKLEKGTKATDWTPAPEDMATMDELEVVDLKHSVETLNNDSKLYKNVASFWSNSNPYTGYIAITTPITPNRMNNIHITGYNYAAASAGRVIDINVGFYNYPTAMVNATFTNNGDFDVEEVRVAKVSSSDTRAVIILGTASKVWYYPRLLVDEALVTYNSPPNSYVDGWSISTLGTSIPSTYAQTLSCNAYNASKTATSYITHIDNNGIYISPASQSPTSSATGNSVKIDGTGMEVYKGGNRVAKFGQSIELSDGTKTLYEVITTSGAVKVTRLYNRSFGEDDMGVPHEDVVALGRTINSNLSVKLNYKINSTAYTATYTSLPVSVISGSKFLFECSLSGTDLTISYGAGDTLLSTETITIVSVVISFTTTQVLAESTLGAYADKTQTGVLRIGNGTGTNAKSNAMLVDLAGNAYFKGEVYTGCSADSTGGVRATNYVEYDGYYSEGSNFELSIDVYRAGAVVMLSVYAVREVSIASGSNLFYASLAGTPIPVPANLENVTGCTYAGANALPFGLIYDEGNDLWRFVMRNAGASAIKLSGGALGSLTYLTDGTLMKDL